MDSGDPKVRSKKVYILKKHYTTDSGSMFRISCVQQPHTIKHYITTPFNPYDNLKLVKKINLK